MGARSAGDGTNGAWGAPARTWRGGERGVRARAALPRPSLVASPMKPRPVTTTSWPPSALPSSGLTAATSGGEYITRGIASRLYVPLRPALSDRRTASTEARVTRGIEQRMRFSSRSVPLTSAPRPPNAHAICPGPYETNPAPWRVRDSDSPTGPPGGSSAEMRRTGVAWCFRRRARSRARNFIGNTGIVSEAEHELCRSCTRRRAAIGDQRERAVRGARRAGALFEALEPLPFVARHQREMRLKADKPKQPHGDPEGDRGQGRALAARGPLEGRSRRSRDVSEILSKPCFGFATTSPCRNSRVRD